MTKKILYDKDLNGITIKEFAHKLNEIEKSLIGKTKGSISITLEDSVCEEDNIMRKSVVINYDARND